MKNAKVVDLRRDSPEDLWQQEYKRQLPDETPIRNRSGIEIKPLYTPADWNDSRYDEQLGYPGQLPMTRGIYPTMHRGKVWSQRQLIGFGTPEDYNRRLRRLLDAGNTAISLIPCNSVYRGYDIDEVDPKLLGTCGVMVNTVDDMDRCFRDVEIQSLSTAMNDPLPFTLLALVLAVAKRRGVDWARVSGTSNQSDYISHYVANHMFFRLSLEGSRRVLVDHIAFCQKHVPFWNPLSIVGQHMQQAGATPAQAMAFTLATGIQYAEDCIARGMDPNNFLERFTFFFDISMSFFEEIAKCRAGRRIWQKIVRERFNAHNPKTWRFKFHGQTSGVDLTRQEPLNNIARVTVQALAGVFTGLQSLHTDSFDEVLSAPTEEAARIAVATQNIIREEAHCADVIDPLAGSYYVESLTDQMEERIVDIISGIDDAGGMFAAVEKGMIQNWIGQSAMQFQNSVESGEQTVVGVNKYISEADAATAKPLERPSMAAVEKQLHTLRKYKAERNRSDYNRAVSQLQQAAQDETQNVYGAIVEAICSGVTHGEVVHHIRQELGFGQPQTTV
ncbi:MAG: acyl-CoA mutase large subunit family protein [Acidiferrobacterales bacterium]|nr:acyl-CoA mutase large subunit family protein [Acidiferrobacterales bacterium]